VTRLLPVLAMLACLALTACATGDSKPDDNKYNGFYGGMSGGTGR
jgi:hypothetical protein